MAVVTIISTCVMRTWPSQTLSFRIGLAKFPRHTWQHLSAQTRHKHVASRTVQASQITKFQLDKNPTRRLLSTEGSSDVDYDNDMPLSEDDDARKSKLKHKKTSGIKVLESVGRFIPHDTLDLTNADGETHVGVTRKEAMILSKQSNMKLVLINAKSKPNPTYRLMSGAELHQERMKAKETQEKEKKPTETKEVTISENIGQHDLQIKRKQIQNWMENPDHQYHVRITVLHKRTVGTPTTVEDKMKLINDILDGLNDVTINAPPKKFGKDGESIRVTLRHMSAKEKIKHKKEKENQQASRT